MSSKSTRSSSLDTIDLLGVPLSCLDSYTHAIDYIIERVHAKARTFCVAVNPEKIYSASTDQELMRILHSADLHICDGVGAAIGAKFLHGVNIARVTGVNLFTELTKRAAGEGIPIFLLGAKSSANEGTCRQLQDWHPELKIAGSQDGYFNNDEDVVDQINQSGAEMLFVALGSPGQEKWIIKHRDKLNPSFFMGVGGTFDVISGEVKRAPKLFQNTGTEWLHRLISDPKRFKRQLVLPKFAMMILRARWAGK